jgi:hypothetical protein
MKKSTKSAPKVEATFNKKEFASAKRAAKRSHGRPSEVDFESVEDVLERLSEGKNHKIDTEEPLKRTRFINGVPHKFNGKKWVAMKKVGDGGRLMRLDKNGKWVKTQTEVVIKKVRG